MAGKGPKSESLMRHCRHRHAHPGKTPATRFEVFLGCILSLKTPIFKGENRHFYTEIWEQSNC
jgi:hypothetical protein